MVLLSIYDFDQKLTDLLKITEIYLEPAVRDFERGREILLKYSDAKLIEVASHWKIPELFGFEGSVED